MFVTVRALASAWPQAVRQELRATDTEINCESTSQQPGNCQDDSQMSSRTAAKTGVTRVRRLVAPRYVQTENLGSPSTIFNSNFGRSPLRQRLARCLVRYRSGPPSALSLRSSGRGIQTNSVSKLSLVT